MSIEKQIEKGLKKLDYVNQWIANCDTKVSFLFTFYGVIITIIFSSDITNEILKTLALSFVIEFTFQSVRLFISFTLLLFFLFSIAKTIYHIYNTLKARIDSSVYSQTGLDTTSKIFFIAIANRMFQNYENEVNAETEAAYLNDINSQVFINSKIASEKFNNYNKSLLWVVVSFATFLLYILIK